MEQLPWFGTTEKSTFHSIMSELAELDPKSVKVMYSVFIQVTVDSENIPTQNRIRLVRLNYGVFRERGNNWAHFLPLFYRHKKTYRFLWEG